MMTNEEVKKLTDKIIEHYRRIGTPVPEGAFFLSYSMIRYANKMGFGFEPAWNLLERLLPYSNYIVKKIDETFESFLKESPQERIFQPSNQMNNIDNGFDDEANEDEFDYDIEEDLPDPHDEDIYGR